jgi:hypothetical protein
MSNFDFGNAGQQKSFDLIPADTIATMHVKIKPGGAGDGGWLKRSKAGDSEALDIELVVVDGEYAKRKLWWLCTVTGATDGHAQAADISRRRLRAVLESARGVRPDDESDAAKHARRIEGWGDFDGLRFIGRIGIEPAKGQFKAKNNLLEVVTPERREWHHVEQVTKTPGNNGAPAAANQAAAAPAVATISRPQWAR